jgi:hypothetical protein
MRRPLAMYYYLFLFVVANTSSVYILVHCIKFFGKIKVLLRQKRKVNRGFFGLHRTIVCRHSASQSESITEKYRLLCHCNTFTSHFNV